MNSTQLKSRAHVPPCARGVARPTSSLSGRATSNSCTMQEYGAAASLRQAPATREFGHTVLRYPKVSASPLPPSHTQAGGTPLQTIGMEILDGLCTVAGMLALAAVAVFILAL